MPVLAAIDEYQFDSEQERAEFRKLTAELRCPKCLNSNLQGSDAPIAADLRAEIYEQLQEGRSEEDIIEFMRIRYGDFILYKPPFNAGTAVLWLGPGLMLIVGFIILRRVMKSSSSQKSGDLSDTEQAELGRLLAEEKKQ